MLRFTSKCSLLLLAVMPRWVYADLECTSNGVLMSAVCRVVDVNRVFAGRLDECILGLNFVSYVVHGVFNAGIAARFGGSLRCP